MTLEPNFTVEPRGNYEVTKFPSNEIQVTHSPVFTSIIGKATITGSILSSDHIIELLQLVETIRFERPEVQLTLVMPYCAYSRQDRRCNLGESFSLKVFAQLINSCNFHKVLTWDNHSDVSTALINNCINASVAQILTQADRLLIKNNKPGQITESLFSDIYDFLISPDAGANKKVFECSKAFNIPMLRADKVRDTKTGNILETVMYATAEQLDGKTVLIVDDIVQGGRTFEELAKAIKAIQPNCTVHLYTTHGFFSHQFRMSYLQTAGISKFITTDSVYKEHSKTEALTTTVIKL